jgi:O-antigen/teichoic acid export membrane protein
VGAVVAPQIIGLWVGNGAAQPSHTLIALLFLWNAVLFLQQPFGYLLAGVSEVRRLTVYSVLTAVVAIPLMLLFAQRWGAEGVVLGLLVGSVPFNLFASALEALRFLRRSDARTEDSLPIVPAPAATASRCD